MAISRFRKTFAKLDPTLYVPEKRNLVPDITPLTNIATGMQSLFDDVSVIFWILNWTQTFVLINSLPACGNRWQAAGGPTGNL